MAANAGAATNRTGRGLGRSHTNPRYRSGSAHPVAAEAAPTGVQLASMKLRLAFTVGAAMAATSAPAERRYCRGIGFMT